MIEVPDRAAHIFLPVSRPLSSQNFEIHHKSTMPRSPQPRQAESPVSFDKASFFPPFAFLNCELIFSFHPIKTDVAGQNIFQFLPCSNISMRQNRKIYDFLFDRSVCGLKIF
jgi:hypothetical protein